jgi:hypothetical protein
MAKQHTKFLLTEGKDDAYAVAGLMSHFVDWGESEEDWRVRIEIAGSITELLKASYISAWLKRSGLQALGILLDANECFAARWASVRSICSGAFPDIPDMPGSEGLILDGSGGIRLGIWMMPDNRSCGMIETFLAYLVPESGEALWGHANEATKQAEGLGAPFKASHEAKACIHSWLAWQDPPGRPFGQALKSKCLDPKSPAAAPFVEWFMKLFDLEGLGAA